MRKVKKKSCFSLYKPQKQYLTLLIFIDGCIHFSIEVYWISIKAYESSKVIRKCTNILSLIKERRFKIMMNMRIEFVQYYEIYKYYYGWFLYIRK